MELTLSRESMLTIGYLKDKGIWDTLSEERQAKILTHLSIGGTSVKQISKSVNSGVTEKETPKISETVTTSQKEQPVSSNTKQVEKQEKITPKEQPVSNNSNINTEQVKQEKITPKEVKQEKITPVKNSTNTDNKVSVSSANNSGTITVSEAAKTANDILVKIGDVSGRVYDYLSRRLKKFISNSNKKLESEMKSISHKTAEDLVNSCIPVGSSQYTDYITGVGDQLCYKVWNEQLKEASSFITAKPTDTRNRSAAWGFSPMNFVGEDKGNKTMSVQDVNPAEKLLNKNRLVSNNTPQAEEKLSFNYPSNWDNLNDIEKCDWIEGCISQSNGLIRPLRNVWPELSPEQMSERILNLFKFNSKRKIDEIQMLGFAYMYDVRLKQKCIEKRIDINTIKIIEVPIERYASNLKNQYDFCFEILLPETERTKRIFVAYINSIPQINVNLAEFVWDIRIDTDVKRKKAKTTTVVTNDSDSMGTLADVITSAVDVTDK